MCEWKKIQINRKISKSTIPHVFLIVDYNAEEVKSLSYSNILFYQESFQILQK